MPGQNRALLDAVLAKVQRDYRDDISLVLAYGAGTDGRGGRPGFDLAFVPKTRRGCQLEMCFVLEGVGYEFFAMPWWRLERIATFEEPLVPLVADSEVVYAATPADMARFGALRRQVRQAVEGELTVPMLDRARRALDSALTECARMQLADGLGQARKHAGSVLYYLSDAICFMNHRYFRRGLHQRMEEFRGMYHLPDRFELRYFTVIEANTTGAVRAAAWSIVAAVEDVYEGLRAELREMEDPAVALRGAYETMVCTWQHRMNTARRTGDVNLAYMTGVSMQDYLDTLMQRCGLARIDFMGAFRANDLAGFLRAVEWAQGEFARLLDTYHVPVRRYGDLDGFCREALG